MANSKRKCKQCGEYNAAINGVKTPAGWFCCFDHAIAFSNDKRAAERIKIANKAKRENTEAGKIQRADIKARKQALKTIPQLIKEAEAAARRYVRARDKPKRRPCPSCCKPFDQVEMEQQWKIGGAWDAGHYRSKGAAPQHRLNVLNIWLQCKSCNAGESKNRAKEITVSQQYRIFMINKLGVEYVEDLENDNSPRKFSREYLDRYKKIFNKRALQHENKNKISTTKYHLWWLH